MQSSVSVLHSLVYQLLAALVNDFFLFTAFDALGKSNSVAFLEPLLCPSQCPLSVLYANYGVRFETNYSQQLSNKTTYF